MTFEYCTFHGPTDIRVLDTVDWPTDLDPTYDTRKAEALIDGMVSVLGAEHARAVLGSPEGWSNGYVLTRVV